MSTQVQYRRGTGVQNDSFTGALAEITVNTTDWTLRVHDGATAGGGQALVGNSATQTLTNKTLGAFTVAGNITGNLLPSSNTAFNLGSNTQAWNSLYVAGNTIYLGTLQLKDSGSNTFAIYTSNGTTPANLVVGAIDVSSISQGTTTIGIATANGNAYVTVGGVSNVVVVTNTGTITTGTASASGTVTGGNLVTAGTLSVSGTTTANAINSTGQISASGNITGGNIIGTLNGSGANVSSISATNISSGTLDQARLANASLTVNGSTIALGGSATITATATGALTIGTGLGGTSYNGSTGVTITNTGVLSLANGGGITASASTGAVTLGSTATSANTAGAIVARGASGEFSAGVITATATNARYADLAEKYTADAEYKPGTVVEFGGIAEITISTQDSSCRIAGVVSTNPAHLMNSTLESEFTVDLALAGRVPVKVQGPVRKGDMMVSAGNGRARAEQDPKLGSVIGKALENFADGEGTIEVLILML